MIERPKICIDRVPQRHTMQLQATRTLPGGAFRAINPIRTAWMNGSTLRVMFMGGTPAQHALVRKEAGWWQAVANLHFEFGSAPDADIRISFDPNDGAWSWIGTECKNIPLNQATMNLGFLDSGTVAHEFGHAIGLAHEHQSPKGGIEWNEALVIQEMAKAPNLWSEATTRHNILRRYSAEQVNGTAFDPQSIMLYFFPAEWTKNGVGTQANAVLSAMDKAFIAGAKMYPGKGATVATATPLQVNARRRTPAALGQVGEEDIFKFTAATDGRYVIDTRGPTDVVLKLFGPGSATALIAEDDDSGLASNARIAANLVAGDYFVQIRHFDSAHGAGQYSVKVRQLVA